MSEDGFSDPNDESSMDLFIETLTGTSFEMRVYPNDTVLDIKNKIHRVEGIPIHHQNLLFQMKELQDYKRLCDVGIVGGSTLKLVLSMRGGPISTRRLNTCDHHIIWKDLKELIEHTRDEIGDKSGSKVSVLVFKEGEVINVIRVIENDDGSYSPYADKTVSPPGHGRHGGKEKDELQQTFFKKISEDMEMATKMHMLKSKMKKLRQLKNSQAKLVECDARGRGYIGQKTPAKSRGAGDFLDYELPGTSYELVKSMDEIKMFENKIHIRENLLHAEQPENGEIALKEKHRSRVRGGAEKLKRSTDSHSRLPPTDPSTSSTSTRLSEKPYFCKNLHIFEPHGKQQTDEERRLINSSILSPLFNSAENGARRRTTTYDNKINFEEKEPQQIAILEDAATGVGGTPMDVPYAETLSLSARNRVHLTRLVLQDSERGKTSPDSIELEENQEMWEIQPGAYKVGLLKRRTSVDHNFDQDFGLEASNTNLDQNDYKNDYEVFGRNYYHVPQFVSAPSAIPPQYAPKDERICDLYLGSPIPDAKIRRSPLYGRRAKNNRDLNSFQNIDYNIYAEEASRSLENLGRSYEDNLQNSSSMQIFPKLHTKSENNFGDFASSIERLQNDYNNSSGELDYEDFDANNYGDDMFGYYNANCTTKILNCNHPRYKEENRWTTSDDPIRFKNDDSQLANEIKRLGFDAVACCGEGKVQIEATKLLDELPAVVSKKRMRCGQCNKRLNITNIYNCRCGRIFCSQHRYSETHECKYDYKTEGRKLLEQQNPLVTATKVTKF